MAARRPLRARLMTKVDKTETCWLWTACKNQQGYGFIRNEGRNLYAHRVSYELHVGPIPDGMQLDHLCRTPSCVNPAHLEPVTPQENTLRGLSVQAFNARKTHCLRGHRFAGDNLRIDPTGRRICRQCKRDADRARRAA